MAKQTLRILQTKPVPKGSPEFETTVAKHRDACHDAIPESLHLPSHYIENAPLDVTTIPRESGLLSQQELEITEIYDAIGLAQAIAQRKLTSVAVVTAFAKRAAIAHQVTNCLTSFFMEDALKRASELDEQLEKTGKTVGPLHGVPVSIKEHMDIKGYTSSYGFVVSYRTASEDAYLVNVLRNLGAVFYCKTMQPQGIMHLETDNHLGRVLNPHNINLTSGGSSGGEAALIAMKGSVLGIGTDIGGSIRGPSGKCGIYGFKPTTDVLTMKGMLDHFFAAEFEIICSIGPMCRTLRDMDFFMNSVLSQDLSTGDQRVIPLPWTGLATPTPKPLKIGIMYTDGSITPQPPVTNALKWAHNKLAQHSDKFVLKPFTPYKAKDAIRMLREFYWPGGGTEVRAACDATGEPLLPLSEHIIAEAEKTSGGRELKMSEMAKQREQRDDFRNAFAQNWHSQDVDVVLCPMFVGPACAHDTSFHWNYTGLWNFVDYPGAVFPTPIRASAEKEKYENFNPWGNQTGSTIGKVLGDEDKHVRQLWEETDFVNAPIDLQLLGYRYRDNQLFGALQALKEVLELP